MSASPQSLPIDDTDGGKLLRFGYSALNVGMLDRAENAFQGLLELPGARAKAFNGLGIVAAFRGEMGDAIRLYRQALEAEPDYALARENLIKAFVVESQRHLDAFRLDDTVETLNAARDQILPGYPVNGECRLNLAQAISRVADGFRSRRGDIMRAIEFYRAARDLTPEDANLRINLDTALSAAGAPAVLKDYTDLVSQDDLGRHLFIACFPKSGSTFLKSALMQATEFPEQNMTFAHGQNETGIYLPDLMGAATRNTVTQMHVRASDSNVRLMQGFGIKPIILVRNIFDVLLSYKEFHDRYAGEISFYDRYDDLDEIRRIDLIVDDRAPWYLAFFASWQRTMRRGRIDGFWITYEDLIADTVGSLDAILRFHGIHRCKTNIEAAIQRAGADKTATHFNKGVAGRGESQFTAEHRAQISRIARYHPDIDFSMIGL